MKDIVLITGVLICGTLLVALTLVNLVYVIQMKNLDRLAESTEESLKRYENNLFARIGRAIAGALFGPDSRSDFRYKDDGAHHD